MDAVKTKELVEEIAAMALSEEEGGKSKSTEGQMLDFLIRKARQLVP